MDLKEELEKVEQMVQTVQSKVGELVNQHEQLDSLTSASAGSQTSNALLKVVVIALVCVGQVYLITGHFAGANSKRRQIDPFG